MNRFALPLALAALLASGCFGHPPGAARPGDTVTIEYTARDAATGEPVALNRTALFALGSGQSGLGTDVEAALVGMQVNETRSVRSPAASRGEEQKQYLNGTVGEGDAMLPIRTSTLRQAFGNVTSGFTFEYNQFFNATVGTVGEEETQVRLVPNGKADEVPDLGVKARGIELPGTRVGLALEPMVGTTFRLSLPIDELGLPAGAYRTLGAEEGRIAFAYSAASLDLVGRDLDLTVRLVSVAPGEPVDHGGNYGARRASSSSSAPLPMPQGDGHTDHTH